jgi:myo-inositol-1(or 4)-monophosphatase
MNLEIVLGKVRSLTMEVADFIEKEAETFDTGKIEYKGFNDLVSYVDKESEKKLIKGLGEILPEAGFIAEEGTSSKKGDEYQWIIDPLDGTTNFTHGLPVFAISIALLKGDHIVLGVVHEINRNEVFYSIENGKAFCNDKEISVSGVKSLDHSLLATGFPYYNFEKMPNYLSTLNELMQKTHGLRRMGSAAVDLVYVACGRFEGFFEYNLNAWDVAAGAFIVQQAGGYVSDFSGGDNYLFGREIAASCEVHQEMLQVIQKNWN